MRAATVCLLALVVAGCGGASTVRDPDAGDPDGLTANANLAAKLVPPLY